MVDYSINLEKDLVEQFRGKPNVEILVQVIGRELQQVYDFYQQLQNDRNVLNAVGKQLDGVGSIAAMSRREASQLLQGDKGSIFDDDELYRQYLIYKILKNTCDCTYSDIVKAFRMFWDEPIWYEEDPDYPATLIFNFNHPEGEKILDLLKVPIIKAGGVGLLYRSKLKSLEKEFYTGFAERIAKVDKTPILCETPYIAGAVLLADEEGVILEEGDGSLVVE